METNIAEFTLEQLVEKIIEARSVREEMEAAESELKKAVADRLKDMKVTGTKVGQFFVTNVSRPLFTGVSLSTAQELGATKSAIDTEKLSALYKKGIQISGIKVIQYVKISEEKEK